MNKVILGLLYCISIILFVSYFYKKYKLREYIFSFYTITIFIFGFTLFLIGPLQYNLPAWKALGIDDLDRVVELYPYLDKVYMINLIGFIVFLIALIKFEFKLEDNKVHNLIKKSYLNINEKVFELMFYLSVGSWYVITLSINKTLPILNNNRLFIEDYGLLKPIYLGLNSIILLCGTLFIIKVINQINKKNVINVVISLVTILATGNRSPLIGLITTILIYLMYRYISNKKLVSMAILCSLLGCGLLGLGIEILRGSALDSNMLTNVAYGNTFSDIRDGAFVLEKYEQLYDGYLWGKNYLADFISFIPSSMSEFRSTWSYGHFTTNLLFGWENHYGLRGGWFLEPYMNFSIIGVIIAAILFAYYISGVELFFYNNIVKRGSFSNIINGMLIISVISIAASSILTSSGFNSIYASFAFVFANIFISKLVLKYNNKSKVV